MGETNLERKLRAILSADVKGYSLLMAEDEIATIQTITSYRQTIKSLIEQHKGRVVDSPGDNLLAEFQSVVDAVECAVKIQKELKEKNDELPSERRMDFRIGVNLGDIVQEGSRIYGDGVNIAARIESLAEPGGVSISGTAFDSVRTKLGYGYRYAGEQKVKNIANPVRIYKVLTKPEDAGRVIGEKRLLGKMSRKVAITAILALAIVAGGLISYYIYLHQAGRIEPASPEKMAFPLPDKPSIAVLPFDNLSGDPEQGYFCDGLTENIIASLSKESDMFVIARNSTFTYKNKPVKVRQVSEELGVRYVLEGSVQRSGERLRITAQLIDAISGHHLWSERYDRNVKDLFEIQDDITIKIITALRVKLTRGDRVSVIGRGTSILEAYLNLLEGSGLLRRWDKEGNYMARKKFEQAISLDPMYPAAYHALASTYMNDMWFGWGSSARESFSLALKYTKKAIELDNSMSSSYGLLGHLYSFMRQHEKSIEACEKAILLNANNADAYVWLGMTLNFADRPEDAVPQIKKAIRLNPLPPSWYYVNLGVAYRMTRRFDDAVETFQKALQRSPTNLYAHIGLTITYILAGQKEAGRSQAARVMELNPEFSLKKASKTWPYKNENTKKRVLAALQEAGLK